MEKWIKKKVENWKKWKVKKQIENCAELKNWKKKLIKSVKFNKIEKLDEMENWKKGKKKMENWKMENCAELKI